MRLQKHPQSDANFPFEGNASSAPDARMHDKHKHTVVSRVWEKASACCFHICLSVNVLAQMFVFPPDILIFYVLLNQPCIFLELVVISMHSIEMDM